MDINDVLQSLFRWVHIVAGVLWIGLLYFFNFVNSAFAPTLDAETKKKVIPQLMPRALFWFRWGAAWTWVSGILLLMLVFYHGKLVFADGVASWKLPVFAMLAVALLAPFIYDLLMKTVGKANMKAAVVLGFGLIAGFVYLMESWAGFSYRGYAIHVGVMFGTIMAFNVWFRIWPCQRKIITAIKEGTAPDPAVVALAGLRSRHNTYFSVPLLWTMINAHTTWAATQWYYLMGFIALGWVVVFALYKKAPKVSGF